MKKIMALAIGLLVMGFAFAAAQTTEEPTKGDLKVKSVVKNAGAVKPMLRHRVQWVDADVDGILDGVTAAPKGTTTPLSGPGAKTWEPYKSLDVVETTDPTTVSDINLLPEATTTVDSEAVTLTKISFRSGLTTPGMVEGVGTAKGAAAKALLHKGRG